MNPIKSWNLKKLMDLGAWGLKTTFGALGPEDISSYKSRTLAPIFTNKTSLSQESWEKSIKIMKHQKNYWRWWLGSKNYIWATWAQKTYPTISPEPWLQYSQTRPHFSKNHKMNLINFEMSKNYWSRSLGPRDYIWATWAIRSYPARSPEP